MSKLVYIKRKPNNTRLPEDVYAGSKRKIGSFIGEHGIVHTGLTAAEEKDILPLVLGVNMDNVEYLKRKADYYANITVDIPLQGASLQIGKDKNQNYLKPTDVLKFKFAITHPWVAKDEASASHGDKRFFIHDPARELKEKALKVDSRKAAYKQFILLSEDSKKMLMVVNLLGTDPSNMEPSEVEIFLEESATNDPERFLKLVKDKDLEIKAFILECISKEVVTKIGNAILEGDEVIGNSMEETVLKLKDKANSDILTRLKARLAQFKK